MSHSVPCKDAGAECGAKCSAEGGAKGALVDDGASLLTGWLRRNFCCLPHAMTNKLFSCDFNTPQ